MSDEEVILRFHRTVLDSLEKFIGTKVVPHKPPLTDYMHMKQTLSDNYNEDAHNEGLKGLILTPNEGILDEPARCTRIYYPYYDIEFICSSKNITVTGKGANHHSEILQL